MTRKVKFRGMIGASLALLYAALWLVTHFVGNSQVRQSVLKEMRLPDSRDDFIDITTIVRPPSASKVYYCRTAAYGPLLVRAEYGWGAGSLRGDGGSAIYLWLFGETLFLREFDHWAE